MQDEDKAPGCEPEAESATEDGVAAENRDDDIVTLPAEELQRRLESAEARAQENWDKYLRAGAEQENIRKRAQKQTEDAHKYANSNFAKSLLSVADNLRRAIEAVPEEKAETDELLKNLLDGVSAVERELLSAFEQNGIEKIEPLGEAFDPNFHQAMFEVESADHDAGTVVQLVAPGYVLNGRLLRAAMVGVAKAPAADNGGS